MKVPTEKRLLQAAILLGCLVPLSAGGYGAWTGAAMLGGGGIDLDSHFRYLSGLLLAIGLGFLTAVPDIESRGPRLRLLTAIVFTGGLCRLLGLAFRGKPDLSMQLAFVMELAVTPLLCLWQASLARKFDIVR